ncbi:hypothetical protein [Arthrobacter psychrolactophilus]|nr:hypothetical protein [Arthrobacter psychrolactophilus]
MERKTMDHYSGDESAGAGNSEEQDEAVDRVFRELAGPLVVPYRNECLVCFLMRVMMFLEPQGFAMTARFRQFNAPRASNLGGRLAQKGIFSDGQLIQAGVLVNETIWTAERCPDCGIPYTSPDCLEVRRGSTQPCKLWRWRRDVERERFNAWPHHFTWD